MKANLFTLSTWLLLSAPAHADAPEITRLEIQPGPRTIHAPARSQQLAVIAHFRAGTSRNVSQLTVFSSSDADVATVNEQGLVAFHQTGEAAIACRYLTTTQLVRLTHVDPKPGYRWPDPAEINFVDRHAFSQLKRLHIAPSDLCTDTEFLRRAYLDVCGILPTPDEVRKFLADPAKDKRVKLVDRLLDRPEYADFWTYNWVETLDASLRQLGEKNARAYQAWIRDHVSKNTPVDRFVRELLTAKGPVEKNPAVNYYAAYEKPTEMAEQAALNFLGVRLQCAACHDRFDAPWGQEDYHGFSAFFAQVARKTPKGQSYRVDSVGLEMKSEWLHPETRKIVPAKFLGGTTRQFMLGEDRREALADWFAAADNPYFAPACVNRVWSKLFGKGIVDPIDDFRPMNPSANDALLDALAKDFVAQRFDQKHLIRTIMNSRTYQLSAKKNAFNGTDEKYFSRRIQTVLYAEQLGDAIVTVMGVPEKFKGMPEGTRFVQMIESEANPPIFHVNRNRWSPCEFEQHSVRRGSNLALALHFINSTFVTDRLKLKDNRVGRLLAKKASDKEILEELFLAALSRMPTERDEAMAFKHVEKTKDRRQAWEDVAWALINTREFLRRN